MKGRHPPRLRPMYNVLPSCYGPRSEGGDVSGSPQVKNSVESF